MSDTAYKAERHEVRRQHTGVRLDEAERKELDAAALAEGIVNPRGIPVRSEILRRRNAFAARHMPRGWTPEDETAQASDAA